MTSIGVLRRFEMQIYPRQNRRYRETDIRENLGNRLKDFVVQVSLLPDLLSSLAFPQRRKQGEDVSSFSKRRVAHSSPLLA